SRFEVPADEQPFWDSAKKFLDAYAARDANALGDLFTEDAEFFDEFGELTQGRADIVALFEQVFENSPEAALEEIILNRVRYITPTVAMEQGETIATDVPGGPRFSSRYVAIHVKGADGVWRMNTLKDYPRESGDKNERLDQLEWLIGDWVNEGAGRTVSTTCEWSEDGNYLLRKYQIENSQGVHMNGVQRIGWDPVRRQLRSWSFDSEGGYAEGYWIRNEDRWIVTSSGYTSDGDAVQATAVYVIQSDERLTWGFTSLVVGNDVQEVVEPVIMVRKPPAPELAAPN
ncbi:MAG TPA: SgcJ/EcaC family oxidoreductase, partial [Planctomycetaceae bacterium]|nr:SgcJ/EcaC family oxidoreductase [Planctomycetaceae bacterium]